MINTPRIHYQYSAVAKEFTITIITGGRINHRIKNNKEKC